MCKRLIYLVFIALVLGLSGVAGAQNQISNWEFDVPIDPLDDWDIWTDDNFNSVSIVEGAGLSGRYAMKVDFTDGASGSMLVFHPYLELQQNATYTISFMAKADAPRTVDVLLQARANNNWTVYWIVGSVELTTEPQTYTYQYTHTGSTVGGTGIYDDDVDLHFNQASSDIDVYYDHIWMGEGAPPPPTGPSSAHTPNPSNGTLLTSLLGGMLGTTLSWTAADNAVSHNVYFGENFDDVNDSTGGTFVVNQPRGVEYILVGYGAMPEDPLPDGLVPGTTYYWRVDEVNDLDPNSPWKGNTWSFKVAPMKAFDPTPVDLGAFVDPDVALSWELGLGVAFQTLYIGDDYDTVNDATTGGIFVAGLTTYDPPAPLEFEKTYYWRVDTTTGAYGPIKGDVWSFKTAKEGGGIRADYYHGMNFETYVLTRLDPQIDFDWGGGSPEDPLINNDLYSVRWTGQLEVAFTETYTFYARTDDGVRLWVDGQLLVDQWIDRGATESRGTIDLVAGRVYDLQMEYFENTGDAVAELSWSSEHTPKQFIPQGALSLPVKASSPNPPNGATGAKMTPTLTWGAGDSALSHQLYFGTDYDAVNDATTASPEYIGPRVLGDESYEPGKLDWESTYYWRVDEINNTHPDSPWKGSVWSFTTGDFLVIDNFEDYNVTDKQIWAIWHDGIGYWDLLGVFHPGNGTGSGVGDEDNDATYMEETIVHSGDMSMPYFYNNNDPSKMKYSEAKLTLINPRDWIEDGVKALSLWFQGIPGSVGSFTDNFDGTYTMTASGYDIWTNADGEELDEFHFAYKPLTGAGSIIARVDSVDNTDPWAKAGVMIRDSLDPNSAHAMMVVTPGSGVSFQRRPDTGATSVDDTVTGITAPQWVKIERDVSGFITASYSDDGLNWTVVGVPEILSIGSNVFIGLALTSHNASATCQAEFSNVQATVSGPWANQDIGIESNEAERMYVAIANSNGTTGTVYYEDNDNIVTDATLIDTWTEFNIDLKDFQDQGVNLADVNSVAIGFGTRGSTTPGGAGKVYIDDIRLYRPRYIPGKGTPLGADLNADGIVDYRDVETMANDWLLQDEIITTVNPGTANLVAYYSLNEGAGAVAGDSAGGHNGTVVGGAQWIAGPDGFGNALIFDGTGSQYVDLGTWDPSAGTGQLSISLWANWGGISGQYMGLIGKRDTWAADDMMWQIEAAQGDGNVGASRESGQTVSGFITEVGQWEHVALTFDGTTGTLYRNGLQVSSGPFSLGPDTVAAMVFGACQANGGNPYNGALDEVRLYNRALSREEIAYVISNGAATLHIPVQSVADLYDQEPEGSKSVNFKDYAILADQWLDEQLWPE